LNAVSKAWSNAGSFFAEWNIHKARHDELVCNSQKIADYLTRAKAPLRFDDLDPSTPEDLTCWVVGNCQFMRERLTIADLLYLAGWLDDEGVSRIMRRVDEVILKARGKS